MIKAFIHGCFFLLVCFAPPTYRCTITVDGLKNMKGILYLGWYGNPSDFLKVDKAIHHQKVSVVNTNQKVLVFDNIPGGTYAISLFLDVDGNGKLSTNFLGIPTEKYAFSNNVKPAFRPASFNESKFTVQGDKSMTIKLK